jgi:alpha-N-acetylglucosaminidase
MRRFCQCSFVGCVALSLLISWSGTALAAAPDEAARDLIKRILPDKADLFILETIPAEQGRDVFEIESRDGKIVVRGSTGVAIASGWNWYLRTYCHCQISRFGNQLNVPSPLPVVEKKVRIATPFPYRYYLNFCAFSYSVAWWDWPQWEQLIDWMALSGVNMPLAVTGQEAVWQRVYRDMGLTDKQLDEFFVGPGYLPFGWMGCIDGFAGPLPQSWIDQHVELQEKILARQRSLGMKPVLQGFTGHAPKALEEVIPGLKLVKLTPWCGFPSTYFVDPQSPLFEKIGKRFIEEQTKLFGTDHLYASDTFIEMAPPSNDPKFLRAMSQSVYGAMAAGDPQAVWVMQGWLFSNKPKFWQPPQVEALFSGVADNKMIVIDLFCELRPMWGKTKGFCGKQWGWNVLQDFGGTVDLHGGLATMLKDFRKAMASPYRRQLVSVGMVNEALGYNPVVNQMIADLGWRGNIGELADWTREFVRCRYGRSVPAANEAWQLLLATAYNNIRDGGSIIWERPNLDYLSPPPPPRKRSNPVGSRKPEYDNAELAKAWQKLLTCADELGGEDTYRFDVVHVGRQTLGHLARTFYGEALEAYKRRDRAAMADARAKFLDLIRDVDRLVATRQELLLGPWLADAKRWATDDQQRRLYEWNARNIITLWGKPGFGLHDYANKMWSGLLTDFYLPRWQQFFQSLDDDLAGKTAHDAKAFEKRLCTWEDQWTREMKPYPTKAQGDSLAVARELCEKYAKQLATPDRQVTK